MRQIAHALPLSCLLGPRPGAPDRSGAPVLYLAPATLHRIAGGWVWKVRSAAAPKSAPVVGRNALQEEASMSGWEPQRSFSVGVVALATGADASAPSKTKPITAVKVGGHIQSRAALYA